MDVKVIVAGTYRMLPVQSVQKVMEPGALVSVWPFKTGVKEPVFWISGTDGVGTKLMLAIKYDKHDTIGQDCVMLMISSQLQVLIPFYSFD